MRVKVDNTRDFFEFLKGEKRSLKDFCLKKGLSYSNAKQWARGERLIPKVVFDRLIKGKDISSFKMDYYKDNWGAIKGGKSKIARLNKKQINMMMKKMRRKKKNYLLKRHIKINKPFLEFFGALMGDGCIFKGRRKEGYFNYIICFTGHKYLDRQYYEKRIIPIAKKEFNVDFHLKERKDKNAIDVIVRNKSLFFALRKLGFPIGKKGKRLKIPKKLYLLDWNYKKYLVRGIFDTDGCFSARKDEGYRYPHISISSMSSKLIKQLYSTLRDRGYGVWMSKNMDDVRFRGKSNAIEWMKDVGSSNERHLNKYSIWLKTGRVPVKQKGL